LEDKYDALASGIVHSARRELVSKLTRATEAHLALDPDAHSPPRVER